MRKPSENDYTVELEGVGSFVYGQRTIGDFLAIRRRFTELTDGSEDPYVTTIASITAVHERMCVSCPEGWENLMDMPLSGRNDIIQKLLELDRLIGEKENSFRQDTQVKG